MIKKLFLKESLVLALIVLVLHLLALNFFLYWTIEWYDILMHFLGGLLIGLLTAYAFWGSKLFEIPQNKIILFLIIIGSVLVVGSFWELWELFVGFSDVLEDKFDTILDLIMDTLGSIVAFIYAKKKLWIEN